MTTPFERHRLERVAHWSALADRVERRSPFSRAYHRRLREVYRHVVPPGLRVLELGCAEGDLLAALEPSAGVGVDFCPAMLERARRRHPHLSFVEADAHDLELAGPFDVVVLSDLVNDLYDVQTVLERLPALCHARTRVVLNAYSRVWQAPLALAQALRLADPRPTQSWLTPDDLQNLLTLTGFEVLQRFTEVLLPAPVPGLSFLANRVLVKLWPFSELAVTNVVVARPVARERPAARVSVVVPARNEAGNIEAVFQRTPELGAGTEFVFVEGHSTDGTYEEIERAIGRHPERSAVLLRQTGAGKGDAVRAGFAAATGEILLILDADLTVAPEDLPRFVAALRSGRAELVNGVRLVYPMGDEAMRPLNFLGNKAFSLAFTWILGQPIKDTLCGTKGLYREDYERIAAARAAFGKLDPFGDFDLLFGAARLRLKIVEVPVRYGGRTYGSTNIRRFAHGTLLFRMLGQGLVRLKLF